LLGKEGVDVEQTTLSHANLGRNYVGMDAKTGDRLELGLLSTVPQTYRKSSIFLFECQALRIQY
jgi:hypothetical protein